MSIESKQLQANNNNYNANERLATVTNDVYSYNRFDLSFSHGTSFNSGVLIPIFVKETLPGDIWDILVHGVIRMSTPASNTMVNPILSINGFYCNNSNLLAIWNNIMGDSSNAGFSPNVINLPKISLNNNYLFTVNDVWNYFGLPTNYSFTSGTYNQICNNPLPFNMYCKIWNDWYRDQNLSGEAVFNYNAGFDSSDNCGNMAMQGNVSSNDPLLTAWFGKGLLPTSRLPDYFSTCLPFQQKGPTVSLNPINLNGWVLNATITNNQSSGSNVYHSSTKFQPYIGLSSYPTSGGYYYPLSTNSAGTMMSLDNANHIGTNGSAYFDFKINPYNQVWTYNGSSSPAWSVNDLRNSITLQHFFEIDARFGTRYNEYLYGHWGILIDPLDVNKSILIGSWEDSLKLSNVVQTSGTTSSSPMGALAGFLQNSFCCENHFQYASQDHGIIMICATVRTPIFYHNNYEKMFLRTDRFDYYDPLFANISDQPVYTLELFSNNNQDLYYYDTKNLATDGGRVFGYNEAWADYRYSQSKLTGYLNPKVPNSISNLYFYSENYITYPKLSNNWMVFNPNILQNTLFKTSSNTAEFYHQFIATFNFDVKVDRKIPLYGRPGINRI